MAIDYSKLATMSQDEARKYLLENAGDIGAITTSGGTNEFDPIYYQTSTVAPGTGLRQTDDGMYSRGITGLFDPEYAGGVYGNYEGIYDKEGNLKDVQFRKGERDEGFLAENLDWIGPLVVGGAMGLGALAGGATAGAGAGAAAGDAAILGGTAADTLGAIAGAEGAAGTAATAGGGAATGSGIAGLGELGINTALSSTQVLANNAYAQAIAQGLSPQIAASAAEVATGLAGSGLSDAAILQSALETAGATSATGAVGAGGSVIGGGGALTAGLTGAASGAAAPLTLTEILSKAGINNVKDALKFGLPIAGLLAGAGGGGGGSGSSNLQNPVHPYKFERTVNPAATPLTSKDAYAYLSGKPSPTTGQPISTGAQNWFTDKFTALDGRDASTGETLIRDPNSGRYIPQSAIDAAQKQVDEQNKADTATGANGGYVFDTALADGGLMALAGGGSTLGGYSDGGRLLRGPGDGVSDSIPATIGGKQPARLADGEFVVPARIVSELGNGSTEAGARKLYAMMDRIQAGRRKTVGKKAVAKDSKADKHLPA